MKKKLLILLACVVIVTAYVIDTQSVSAATSGVYTYTVSKGEATITKCSTSASGDLVIPKKLGGYPVVAIGTTAFQGCNSLTSITIPEGVREIGTLAFNSVKKITAVSIPSTVTSIATRAFSYCSSLESIVIPDGVTRIGNQAFLNCTSLKSVTLPEGVKEISEELFNGCTALTDVIIPSTVTAIEINAFYNCSALKNVSLPEGLKSISSSAFYGCKVLENINIPTTVTSIGGDVFYNCKGLKEVVIPEGITTINSSTFYGCSNLKTLTIPKSVTSIYSKAFYGCYSLDSIIYRGSDLDWTSLSISSGNDYLLKAGVTYDKVCLLYSVSDDKATIKGCSEKLTGVLKLPSSYNGYPITTIGSEAFYGFDDLTEVVIPSGVLTISSSAFESCDNLAKVTLSSTVTSVSYRAFAYCKNLTKISIPSSVTKIGKEVFYKSGIYNDETNWEDGVLYIGDCLIVGSDTVSGLYLVKEGTRLIAENAFYNNKVLTSVIIPEGVKYINSYAFYYCSSLIRVVLPKSITKIGTSAFNYCKALDDVYLGGSSLTSGAVEGGNTYLTGAISWTNIKSDGYFLYMANDGQAELYEVFPEVSGNVVIPSTLGGYPLVTIYNAFYDCSKITGVVIPSSVKKLESNAFGGCTGLKSIILPEGITEIKRQAFYCCNNLSEIQIPNTVTTIGEFAFYECVSLADVYYTGTQTEWEAISISERNEPLENANIRYNYIPITKYLTYTVTDGEATITGCNKSVSGEFMLPEQLGGGLVTRIAENAFKDCTSLNKLIISSTLKSVGENAFYNTGIYNNPDNWVNCGLYVDKVLIEAKNLPNYYYSVKKDTICIADGAFAGCTNLQCILLPSQMANIGKNALSDSEKLEMVFYMGEETEWKKVAYDATNSVLDNVAVIGDFRYLTKDDITYTVIDGAVKIISIKTDVSGNIIIPSDVDGCPVTIFGERCFNNLTYVTAIAYSEGITDIPNLGGCTYLKAVAIPEGVKSLSNSNFYCLERLEKAYIPSTLIEIGQSVFSGTKLVSITLPDSVESIGYEAFYSCCLETVTIPASVKQMGTTPFRLCSKLKAINVDENNEYFASVDGVLFDKNVETLLWYPSMKETTSYAVPNTVTTINKWGFLYADRLTEIILSDNVVSIEESGIDWCAGLIKVVLGKNVSNIGNYVFYNCKNLENIDVDAQNLNYASLNGVLFDKSVKTLIYYPRGKTEKAYTLPDGVTVISDSAFSGCTVLTDIKIPGSITRIGKNAFYSSSKLKNVIYVGTETKWSYITILDGNTYLLNATRTYEVEPKAGAIESAIADTDLVLGTTVDDYVVIVPTSEVAMTESELAGMLNNEEITITSNDGIIGTGSMVNIGEYEVYIVVKGDVNGDGISNVFDALMVKKALKDEAFENETLREYAADVDGEVGTTVADVSRLLEYVVGKTTIG